MSSALVTLAVGTHEELLEIALPSFHQFADRHGYETIVADVECERPPSWHKVPAIRGCLMEYDEVLWVDADVVIVDSSEDLSVPADAWQAMVAHHTNCGEVPNLGVWLVRRPMLPILDRIWTMTQYLDHGWWEQAAMCDLLGYREWPLRRTLQSIPVDLYARTHFLDPVWNVHIQDTNKPGVGRFLHATQWPDRAGVMREWAQEAAQEAVA